MPTTSAAINQEPEKDGVVLATGRKKKTTKAKSLPKVKLPPNPFQSEILDLVSKQRTNDKKIVLCHGCFDLLHIGHINYLKKAKSLGEILIVTVTADEYVNKGPEHPIFNENQRADHLSELSIVNYVSINYSFDATEIIKSIRLHSHFCTPVG